MIRRKRLLQIAAVSVILFGGIWWFSATALPVDTIPDKTSVTVTTGPLVEIITVAGRVVPRTSIEITCKASGTVVTVPVQASSLVRKLGLSCTNNYRSSATKIHKGLSPYFLTLGDERFNDRRICQGRDVAQIVGLLRRDFA